MEWSVPGGSGAWRCGSAPWGRRPPPRPSGSSRRRTGRGIPSAGAAGARCGVLASRLVEVVRGDTAPTTRPRPPCVDVRGREVIERTHQANAEDGNPSGAVRPMMVTGPTSPTITSIRGGEKTEGACFRVTEESGSWRNQDPAGPGMCRCSCARERKLTGPPKRMKCALPRARCLRRACPRRRSFWPRWRPRRRSSRSSSAGGRVSDETTEVRRAPLGRAPLGTEG